MEPYSNGINPAFGGIKKKICVVTTNRADYGRMKPVMEKIRADETLSLQVVAGTSLFLDHLLWYLRHGEPTSFWKSLPWYVKARGRVFFGEEAGAHQLEHLTRTIVRDGFPVHARLPLFLEGGNTKTMVKTAGLGLLGIPDIFQKLQPDIVLINGDRFEIFSVAMAAAFSNIRVAHIEGGDASGTIDDSIRHAISKLAHIHFPATQKSRDRLLQMGENSQNVFVCGSPIIDTLKSADLSLDNSFYARHRSGGIKADLTKDFFLVMHHPVTTEYADNYRNTKELIAALAISPLPSVFFASNIDAGSDGVSKAIREYRDQAQKPNAAFFKSIPMEDFYRAFSHARVLVGNSSSFLREAAFLGVPAVVVGNRQQGRERGENVIETPCDRKQINDAIQKQMRHGAYASSNMFGDGNAAEQIVQTLSRLDVGTVSLQKQFFEI
jgi:UDP-hydrolysing UDP-N-acetyl-D-glucosamine 2-epimerase